MLLELKNVSACYERARILRGLSLTLGEGDIGCLLGPSGSGKTTALRCIAGFEPVTEGEIRLAGELVSTPTTMHPAEVRGIGMVFQDYALLPHLTVRGNVEFGLRNARKPQRHERAEELLEAMGLMDHADHYPHQLSGGQQQRVAIARALAPRPRLLLMDEPFSDLDIELRERLSMEVRELLKNDGITTLIVTHDQQEAFALADEIGVLNAGKLEQWSSAYDLYYRPRTRFVADFVGQGVMVPGEIAESGAVRIELGELRGQTDRPLPPGTQVDVLLRPDDIIHDDNSSLTARVLNKAFRGSSISYTLESREGTKLLALVPSHHNHDIGEDIGIRLSSDHVVVFEKSPSA